jgi:hypothetical protein
LYIGFWLPIAAKPNEVLQLCNNLNNRAYAYDKETNEITNSSEEDSKTTHTSDDISGDISAHNKSQQEAFRFQLPIGTNENDLESFFNTVKVPQYDLIISNEVWKSLLVSLGGNYAKIANLSPLLSIDQIDSIDWREPGNGNNSK